MNNDQKLIKAAFRLVQLMDKGVDSSLPKEIADVVKLHAKLGVASAWIPLPGVDLAAGAASIWSMYVRINNKLGLKIGDNALKTICSGVATNLAGYVAMSGVLSALKFIPVIGQIGSAVIMSAAQYALLLASGYIYLQALSLLLEKTGTLDLSRLGGAVQEVLKDKTTIKNFMDSAQSDYKKS